LPAFWPLPWSLAWLHAVGTAAILRLYLMEKKEYDKISVTEICRMAGLDRRTFYRNFISKNDVLEQYIKQLQDEYIQSFSAMDEPCQYTAARVFFEFWSRHLSFIRSMKKSGLIDFAFQRFEKFTKEHSELLMGDDVRGLPLEYVFAYRIGGFWNVMLTWASQDKVLSPDEMAAIVIQL
jgi:AcrR family transcriptional regulator